MITKEQLEADKALCKKATPGPWYDRPAPPTGEAPVVVHSERRAVANAQHNDDGAFIARARTAMPEYIAELEALRAQPQSPAELVQRIQETEDALLAATGWKPTGRPDHYLDTQGDERWSPGAIWPRSTALDFARERVMRGAK